MHVLCLMISLLCLTLLAPSHTHAAQQVADTPITIQVDTTHDVVAVDGLCSLREAIQATNTHTAVDTCPAGTTSTTILVPAGHYPLTAEIQPLTPDQGSLKLGAPMTIKGQGLWPNGTILDGQHHTGIFLVDNPTVYLVQLQNLELAQGQAPMGGAIWHHQGPLLLRTIRCYWNVAEEGGCIFKQALTGRRHRLRIVDSTIQENRAGGGGAIWFTGQLHLQRTQIFGNRISPDVVPGEGPNGPSGEGPGLFHNDVLSKPSQLTFENLVLVGNSGPLPGECRLGSGALLRLRLLGQNTLGLGCTLAELLGH